MAKPPFTGTGVAGAVGFRCTCPGNGAIHRVGFVRGALHVIAIDYVATQGDHHHAIDANAQDLNRIATTPVQPTDHGA